MIAYSVFMIYFGNSVYLNVVVKVHESAWKLLQQKTNEWLLLKSFQKAC